MRGDESPCFDPQEARSEAIASLVDRMGGDATLVEMALYAREAAVCLPHGTSARTAMSVKIEQAATIAETIYFDSKYGYGIRPWLPLLWAGWKPEIQEVQE